MILLDFSKKPNIDIGRFPLSLSVALGHRSMAIFLSSRWYRLSSFFFWFSANHLLTLSSSFFNLMATSSNHLLLHPLPLSQVPSKTRTSRTSMARWIRCATSRPSTRSCDWRTCRCWRDHVTSWRSSSLAVRRSTRPSSRWLTSCWSCCATRRSTCDSPTGRRPRSRFWTPTCCSPLSRRSTWSTSARRTTFARRTNGEHFV